MLHFIITLFLNILHKWGGLPTRSKKNATYEVR